MYRLAAPERPLARLVILFVALTTGCLIAWSGFHADLAAAASGAGSVPAGHSTRVERCVARMR